MNKCPTCQKKIFIGELFCSECGAQLAAFSEGGATQIISKQGSSSLSEPISILLPEQNSSLSSVSLIILNAHHTITLSGQETFTLGRDAEGQLLHPDIDLSAYQGYEMGVSRLHASLRVCTKVTATDLGSSNGTKLNGVKMEPNKAYHLQHRDILTLGKLKIQVLVHPV
jgi:pSer/pThr/pTyr-binding forkhead associated (FHA) protein